MVENMTRVAAAAFLGNRSRVISIDNAMTTPTAKTPEDGMKRPTVAIAVRKIAKNSDWLINGNDRNFTVFLASKTYCFKL
jgi:hypothetical protein